MLMQITLLDERSLAGAGKPGNGFIVVIQFLSDHRFRVRAHQVAPFFDSQHRHRVCLTAEYGQRAQAQGCCS